MHLQHRVLHLLGGVSIPSVVVLLAVLLRPQSADIPILLELFGPLLPSLCGLFFSEQTEENRATVSHIKHLIIPPTLLTGLEIVCPVAHVSKVA